MARPWLRLCRAVPLCLNIECRFRSQWFACEHELWQVLMDAYDREQ